MSHRSSVAQVDPTPTPTPASEQRIASTPQCIGIDADAIDRFAKCRSFDELPSDLQANPFIRYAVSLTPEEEARELAALSAHREAEALYGDDPERILAAMEAGTHPLQQRAPASR